ncbi:MAG: hypothetical protein NVS3B25_32320 [Hymenobacter sp.]
MTDEDYKTLLRQAEEELGHTPGAYCSRKAALRAMELLRAAGQVEFDEAEKKLRTSESIAKAERATIQAKQLTIERLTRTIMELQEEKTRDKLGSGIEPKPDISWERTKEGFMEPRYISGKAQMVKRYANPENDSLRRGVDPYFDNAKQF